jgi:hypothetical protein
MPVYMVNLVVSYPVTAASAEDAYATVPMAFHLRPLAGAEGQITVTNEKKEMVLRAQLVPGNKFSPRPGKVHHVRVG